MQNIYACTVYVMDAFTYYYCYYSKVVYIV